jgi:hypothetical protein
MSGQLSLQKVARELDRVGASGGARLVSAAAFQEQLERLGMPLGSARADAVVLQCSVRRDGMVDYSALAAPRAPGSVESPSKVARPVVRPPPPPPLTVDTALLGGLGPEPEPVFAMPPPASAAPTPAAAAAAAAADAAALKRLAPRERVRAATGQLRNLFKMYDNGLLTMQGVHSSVAALGLEETAAFSNLMRSAPLDMTFAQLYQALLQTSDMLQPSPRPSSSASTQGAASTRTSSSSSQFVPNYPPVRRDETPGAWPWTGMAATTAKAVAATPAAAASRAPAGAGAGSLSHSLSLSPRASESVDSPWNTERMGEGAGVPPARIFTQIKAQHSAAAGLDFGAQAAASHKRFGGPSQRSNHSTLALGSPKLPHAADVLKENVYACIRFLDQGRITAPDFERRLVHLGLDVSHEVRRLLAKAEADATVNFTIFARALEPALQKHAQAAAPPPPPPQQLPVQHQHLQQHPQQLQATPHYKSIHGHGDLIAWSEGPGELEQEQRREGGRRHAAGIAAVDAHRSARIDLSWDDTAAAPAPLPAPKPGQRGANARAHVASARNILAWDEPGAGMPGGAAPPPRAPPLHYPYGVEYTK